jgi:hypothetical protein
LDSILRRARLNDVLQGGIVKTSNKKLRRTTLGGMIGDKVIIPGSPAISLPELLQQAEITLNQSPLPKSPLKSASNSKSVPRPIQSKNSEREWTRADWKQLDACFTEERLEIGARKGLPWEQLADVDDINIEDVVTRFIDVVGGYDAVRSFGSAWTQYVPLFCRIVSFSHLLVSEGLLARARALRKKQMAGLVVPPTPQFLSTRPSEILHSVPPSPTPLPQQDQSRPVSSPSKADRQLQDLAQLSNSEPRYSELFEEARAIQDGREHSSSTNTSKAQTETSHQPDPPAPVEESSTRGPLKSMSTRMKGILYSYLPKFSKPSQAQAKMEIRRPGLPLPPQAVLEKARGPVITPTRMPPPKSIPPKDLVHLQPPPPPPPQAQKLSNIPRPKPQRMVELHPVPPPLSVQPLPRPRRSSGSSVKDLVRCFEELDNRHLPERIVSGRGVDVRKKSREKPIWKP